MTLDEAKEVLKDCVAYLDWHPGAGEDDEICVDGWLTLKQLEAVIIVARFELAQSQDPTTVSRSLPTP